ncbi:hypothetical protein VTK73DRAFT_2524 [Phialemonium thermophilum]|uniref:Uncharacterized protein n=1 Tax=Phialemonium thermophilum TaxID=223376 RepID=A0ABR3VS22_9PEZI
MNRDLGTWDFSHMGDVLLSGLSVARASLDLWLSSLWLSNLWLSNLWLCGSAPWLGRSGSVTYRPGKHFRAAAQSAQAVAANGPPSRRKCRAAPQLPVRSIRSARGGPVGIDPAHPRTQGISPADMAASIARRWPSASGP